MRHTHSKIPKNQFGPSNPNQTKRAMRWWNSQSAETKAHLRRVSNLTDAIKITRYWLSTVATLEESAGK